MPDFSFRRSNRLLSSAEFQPLFDAPDFRASGPTLLVLASRRSSAALPPRLGLVVGRKRVRLAVNRNIIKRVSRESFRQAQARLVGLDVLVLVRAPLHHPDRPKVRAELEQLWDKLLAKAGQA